MKRIIILLAVVFATFAAQALDVGDKAASLKGLTKWYNGKAVDPAKPDGKTVYVVEFWATWCGPCRQTIPHLNKLNQEYKDQGVVFVGISDEPSEKVELFMTMLPMEYLVALDTEKTLDENFRQGLPGIPYAFIVNKKGVVVWRGHPMDGMEQVLDAVLEDKFDAKKMAARQAEKEKLSALYSSGDFKQALAKVDELLAADPDDVQFNQMKAGILVQLDDGAGVQAQLKKLLALAGKDADALQMFAWMVMSLPTEHRDPALAMDALSLMDADMSGVPAVLALKASIYADVGLFDKAIQLQEQVAAQVAGDDKGTAEGSLSYYRKLQALQKKLTE